jgi:hypothetical protein
METSHQFTPEETQEQNRLLAQDLGRYYETHTEDQASLARIRERLLQKGATSLPVVDTGEFQRAVHPRRERDARREFRSTYANHSSLTTLAAAVLVAILLGSFALALQRQGTHGGSGQAGVTPISSTLSRCASQPFPVLVDLCTHRQLTDLRQSRTIGTYVIELERAYLDMNQLLIIYRVFPQSPGRQIPASLTDALATTSQGLAFQFSGGAGSANGLNVVQFSTPALPASTRILHFQVEVKALRTILQHPPLEGIPPSQPTVVRGSATFDFSLSYHAGLVVTPHQTVTVNGGSVTLEHVLISPSQTIVEGTTHGKVPTSMDYTFLLQAAGRNASPASSGFGSNGPFLIVYNDGLLGQHGTWTFKITAISGQAGPWTFHFNVP